MLAGAALLGSVGFASAADLETYGSTKDAPAVVAYGPSWAGLYVGASVGFGVGDTTHNLNIDIDRRDEEQAPQPSGDVAEASFATQESEVDFIDLLEDVFSGGHDVNGAVYGLHIGYNLQYNKTVLGIEAGIFGSDINGEDDFGLGGSFNAETELDYYGRVIGRLGYAEGNTMFYGFGGLAWGDVTTTFRFLNIAEVAEAETSHVGWTAGVGLEHAFNDRFSVRIEYAHVDLGEESADADFHHGTVSEDIDLEFDTIKIGASYKLFSREPSLEPYK